MAEIAPKPTGNMVWKQLQKHSIVLVVWSICRCHVGLLVQKDGKIICRVVRGAPKKFCVMAVPTRQPSNAVMLVLR